MKVRDEALAPPLPARRPDCRHFRPVSVPQKQTLCRPPAEPREACIWLFVSTDNVYPLTLTSRLTTGQFTTNPLGPNGLPAGNPVTLPSATCCKAAEKSVWRRLSPAITAASVQVARWMSHIGL